MQRFLPIVLLGALLSGCGYSSVDNEVVGQPKKLIHQTPILCENRDDVDVSLGVMRNGVGSMSTQDQLFTLPDKTNVDILNKAIAEGKLVRIHFDDKRFTWCWESEIITKVEVLEDNAK